jgi:hypothetical protein
METCDGSMGFDFDGTYANNEPFWMLTYAFDDMRRVEARFKKKRGMQCLGMHLNQKMKTNEQFNKLSSKRY